MNRSYPDGKYDVPKKNVLLISCIDLRLTDDLVRFMDHDNLTNRYDHFVLAGCSLGITLPELPAWQNAVHKPCAGHYGLNSMDFQAWWITLKNHIQIAIDLHDIHDIYLVEHEACGAYQVLVNAQTLSKYREQGCQNLSSRRLEEKILAIPWKNSCRPIGGIAPTQSLHVHRFRMDIRGNVEYLK